MNADDLGEKGESRFREICADAGLIGNKSERDRAGWDFVVDFPFGVAPGGAIDRRTTPLSCHVQVKTVLASTKRVRLRLSAAERLAKEAKPSFICIFQLREDMSFCSLRLIHILDGALGLILKRLRIESAKGRTKINDMYISFPISHFGKQLDVSGAELRREVAAAVGGDLASYLSTKQRQLNTLGYVGSGRGFEISMNAPSIEHVVDTFLGLEQSVEIQVNSEWDERFGIKIATPKGGPPRKSQIQPLAADECTVQFRETALSVPISFEGEIFFPAIPNLPPESMKALVRTNGFTIQIKLSILSLSCNPANVKPQTPRAWSDFWRLMRLVQLGGEMTFIPHKINPPMTFPLTPMPLPLGLSDCEQYAKLCDDISTILQIAGARQEPQLSILDLDNVTDGVAYVAAMCRHEEVSPPTIPETFRFAPGRYLWMEFIAIGQGGIAFAASLDLYDIPDGTKASAPELRSVRHLSGPTEFAAFEDELRACNKTEGVFGGRPLLENGQLIRQAFAAEAGRPGTTN